MISWDETPDQKKLAKIIGTTEKRFAEILKHKQETRMGLISSAGPAEMENEEDQTDQ